MSLPLDLLEKFGGLVSLVSLLGIALLSALLASQRRDIHELRSFMQSDPSHAAADLAESEHRLDRAEREMAVIYAELGDPVPGTQEFEAVVAAATVDETVVQPEPLTSLTSASLTRVTAERPALERVTMERSALAPHPHLRRFGGRAVEPRWLAAIALGATLIAASAIVVSGQLLKTDQPEAPARRAGAIDPATVEVAVLNGTTAAGLGQKVSSDVQSVGYKRGAIGNIQGSFNQSVVQYDPTGPRNEKAAKAVGRALGIHVFQKFAKQTQKLAAGAPVVVIAGEDRARS